MSADMIDMDYSNDGAAEFNTEAPFYDSSSIPPTPSSTSFIANNNNNISNYNNTINSGNSFAHSSGDINSVGTNRASMAEQQAKLQQRYGGLLPPNKGLTGQKERKYFDSGDYNLSIHHSNNNSVGTGASVHSGLIGGLGSVIVGSEHPRPENIPHSAPLHAWYGAIPSRRGSLSSSTLLHDHDMDIEQQID